MQDPDAPSPKKKNKKKTSPQVNSKPDKGLDNEGQFSRAYVIHRRVFPQQNHPKKYPTWVTMKELEDEVGAGEDTIRRCMRTMRDLLDLPIHYVPEKNGYGYTQKVTGFPLLIMTEDDLSAMVMGQQMLALCAGTDDEAKLKRVLRKAFINAGPDFAEAAAKLEQAISFYNVGFNAPVPVDPKLRDELTRACANREELIVEHCSAKPGAKPKSVLLHPLQVAHVNGAFYLYHDNPALPEPERRQKFALSRVRGFRKTGKLFKAPPFNRQEVLDSFGLFGDPRKAVQVRIRFSARVAPLILERPWHKSQEVAINSDNTLEITLLVAPTIDLESAVLRWAGDIEVLAPESVRDAIRARGEALVAAHQKRASA